MIGNGDDDGDGWSSLSRSSSDGGFDGGLGLCSFWWVVVLWQWKSGLCRLCSCCWVVVLWQWLWIVPFVVFFFVVVVCIILLEWIYYFIVVDILFYCDVHIILLC